MAFRGAPTTATERAFVLDGDQKSAREKRAPISPGSFILIAGTVLLLLVTIIPMLSAARLMANPTFVFFVGRTWPMRIIYTCLACVLFYMVLILLFFTCARYEHVHGQAVFSIATLVTTLLGISLLLLSTPLWDETSEAYLQVTQKCQVGSRTSDLVAYAAVLQTIRATPACSVMMSVKMCDAFQASMPYTGFLESMENQYKCAGFCQNNLTMAAAAKALAAKPKLTSTSTTTTPVVASKLGEVYQSNGTDAAGLLAHVEAMSDTDTLDESTPRSAFAPGTTDIGPRPRLLEALQRLVAKQMQQENVSSFTQVGFLQMPLGTIDAPSRVPPPQQVDFSQRNQQVVEHSGRNAIEEEPGKSTRTYPPTLFSAANYKASCDGMASRDLKYQAMTAAQLLYVEGVILLASVVFGGLLKTCNMCIKLPDALSI